MAQSFYPSAQTIIDQALTDIGAIDPEGGITPTSTQRTGALQVLNLLVTSWQSHGMQVWCQKIGTSGLAAATSSYTLGPSGDVNIARPLSVTQAWLRDTTADPDIDIPIRLVSREEYYSLTQKEVTGTPVVAYYDPQYDLPGSNSGASAKGKLFVWPAPDSAAVTRYDLYFIYTRPIQDFSAVSDNLDFPQEWYNAVRWNLALNLTTGYEVPVEKFRLISKMADDTLLLALSNDRENTSVFLSPAQA
jgi:hypothetical protein